VNKLILLALFLTLIVEPSKVLVQAQDVSDQILEELDDLEDLRNEIDENDFLDDESNLSENSVKTDDEEVLNPVDKELDTIQTNPVDTVNPQISIDENLDTDKVYFEIGKEERELLQISEKISAKMSVEEWDSITQASDVTTYTVVEGDWLFKISKKLFGTGFYYPKIWALNPYITNPHEIEPGMVLVLSSGGASEPPELKMGSFDDDSTISDQELLTKKGFEKFGEEIAPDWLEEKKKLQQDGAYVNYTSEEDADILLDASKEVLNEEYKKYSPPEVGGNSAIPSTEYDRSGFDKNAKVEYNFKEGFSLNTFISSNFVQDFGYLESAVHEGLYLTNGNRVFINFEGDVSVQPGDTFSIYRPEGKVANESSDRFGYRYTVIGSVKILQKLENRWQAELFDVLGEIKRGSRVTVYTPKIGRILKTFNTRVIEAAIVQSYSKGDFPTFGDVVYLDRGRADGVEMGNIFEVYGFKDRNTKKNIVNIPAYKNGELTVISLTDNFATALVTLAIRELKVGEIAITKSSEQALLSQGQNKNKGKQGVDASSIEQDLKIDLNLDDIGNNLYDKAKEINLTAEEMAELERQEREKSVLSGVDRDLRNLEILENELAEAENILNQSKLDEDKFLESKNLELVERNANFKESNQLEQIEEKFGKKYLDDQLVIKDNPYGLTEFDIEEVDELMSRDEKLQPLDKKSNQQKRSSFDNNQSQDVNIRSSATKKEKLKGERPSGKKLQ
jgi:hypothetical protein